MNDAKEKVWMEHPNLGPDRKEQVTRRQLQNVWRYAGWRETEAPPPPPPPEESIKSLNDYTVAELRAMAKEENIKGVSSMKKGALIEALSD